MNKTKLCDNCNSEVVIIRKGSNFVAECSYCGEIVEKGIVIENFLPEFDEED